MRFVRLQTEMKMKRNFWVATVATTLVVFVGTGYGYQFSKIYKSRFAKCFTIHRFWFSQSPFTAIGDQSPIGHLHQSSQEDLCSDVLYSYYLSLCINYIGDSHW